ncbi:MAG: protein kinase [Acidobacteriota bacterium]
MKRCPKCKKEFYDKSQLRCPDDDTKLAIVSERDYSTDLLIGMTIDGKYKLERRIGRGGMGAVYSARHTNFNKQVAIKILSHDIVEEDPSSFERFRREAEASARFKHPNAVPVSDFGQTTEGITYLVMEYIEGVTLRNILDRERRLPPARTVELGRQICAAIAAAHRAGIIHRDLKPDNVMIEVVDGKEIARVLDFGIAKLKDVQQQGRITETGNVLGTPHYMSPEQCSGNIVDHRADIYALGVMLYEMVSGDVPFNAPTAPAIIVQQVTKDPRPISEVLPDVPAPLERVVMRALEKLPSRRQQSATDLANQLEAALEISTTPNALPSASLPTSEPTQWRVIFQGLLENSEDGRQRLLEGLQRSFGLSLERAEELLKNRRASVKKTKSQEEATRIAEKLRAIGADVKIEPIVETPLPTTTPTPRATEAMENYQSDENQVVRKTALMAATQKMSSSLSFEDEDLSLSESSAVKTHQMFGQVPADPLLVTDGYEMLSYLTEKAKIHQTEINQKPPTDPINEVSQAPQPIETSAQTDQIVEKARETTKVVSESDHSIKTSVMESSLWMIDINGLIHDNMMAEDVEAWIRSGRLRTTYKARKGGGHWYELGNIPQFRRVFEEINPNTFVPLSAMQYEAKKKEEEHSSHIFLQRMLKLGIGVFILYLAVSLGMQFGQRYLLEDNLRVILENKPTILALRDRVRVAIRQRNLIVSEKDIHISVDPPKGHIAIRIDYQRTLLRIPLHYQARYEKGGFELPIQQLAKVPDGDIEIVGDSVNEIIRYRQEQIAKLAAASVDTYEGEPDTVARRDQLLSQIEECEEALTNFEMLLKSNKGEEFSPTMIRVRGQEYTKEELKNHTEELKKQLEDVKKLLKEEYNRKIEAEKKKFSQVK